MHVGSRHGTWTIVSAALPMGIVTRHYYMCECDCGEREFVDGLKLSHGEYPACSECRKKKRALKMARR